MNRNEISIKRGSYAINIVKKVLEVLKQARDIRDFIISLPSDSFDARGIDAVVFLTDNILPIQVKSSRKRAQKHFKHHPSVRYLVAIHWQPQKKEDQEKIIAELTRKVRAEIIRDFYGKHHKRVVLAVEKVGEDIKVDVEIY